MTDDLVGQLRRDRELYGLELWPGYERQSWPERFAELDRQTSARCSTLQNAIIAMSAQHAARIEALEAALRPFAEIAHGEVYDRFKADSRSTFRISNGGGDRHLTFINAECFDEARTLLGEPPHAD